MPKNLNLANNYRSDGHIINYNNKFFDFLFPLGDGYKGEDRHSVPVIPQEVPLEERVGAGSVLELHYNAKDEKFSADEIEVLEAKVLLEKMKELLKSEGSIAVLYSKLKASNKLISLLMRENIGFTAQVKVPYGEDPIIGLFYQLLRWQLNHANNAHEIHSFLIAGYLQVLGINKTQNEIEQLFKDFVMQAEYVSVIQSYKMLLSTLGMANSNIEPNLNFLESLSSFCHGDVEKLYYAVKKNDSEKYSMDFQFGHDSNRITLMTVHSSKGLQFDSVFLAGLYTNGTSRSDSSFFGDLPGSFQWAKDEYQTKLFKTPHYLYEKVLEKIKNFSESKRLFYVANTRAVHSLIWAQISQAKVRDNRNNWINAINLFENTDFEISTQEITDLRETHEDLSVSKPLFHLNNMGISPFNNPRIMGLSSEQSVTTLSTIAICPRKFYLSEVLKLSKDDLQFLEIKAPEIEQITHIKSSAERGTYFHEELEKIIQEQSFSTKHPELEWIVDKLRNFRDNTQLIPEKLIKFDLFNVMITGVPDLIVIPDDHALPVEIWDYKTGSSSETKNLSYNFQLLAYSYGISKIGLVNSQRPIKRVICYIDEKKVVEETDSFSNVENKLYDHWLKLSRLHQADTKFCASCEYKNICREVD
jgi:ATP-dependent helicase/nuclease subunit A